MSNFDPLVPVAIHNKLIHLNFNLLEVVSRYRDPQLQVGENYSFDLKMFGLKLNKYE